MLARFRWIGTTAAVGAAALLCVVAGMAPANAATVLEEATVGPFSSEQKCTDTRYVWEAEGWDTNWCYSTWSGWMFDAHR